MDTDKLKRLAEDYSDFEFIGVNPKSILALIAENERLRALASLDNKAILREGLDADRYQRQRDEAVALLQLIPPHVQAVSAKAFLARIDSETSK